jgi:hypothetical protein
MYMRGTRSRMDPSRIDEAAARAAQDVQAVIKRLPIAPVASQGLRGCDATWERLSRRPLH